AAGERQLLRGASYDPATDLVVAGVDGVLRDFEPPHLEAGHDRDQVAHEEALGAADIEHAVAGLEPEMLGHVAGGGRPAPVVAVAAIALVPGAVEIFPPELARNLAVGLLAALARDQITLGARILGQQVDLSHGPSPRQALPAGLPPAA